MNAVSAKISFINDVIAGMSDLLWTAPLLLQREAWPILAHAHWRSTQDMQCSIMRRGFALLCFSFSNAAVLRKSPF